MKFSTILFFTLLTFLVSCHGQNSLTAPLPKGEVVSQLDTNIWIIFQDMKHNYWFGSDGQGLYRYDGKIITHFSTKDGLPNNRIREIKEDQSGRIYITTLEGISQFDGQTFMTLKPTESEAWKSGKNDLWFKGNNGPYRFDGQTLYHLKFPKHPLEDDYYAIHSDGVSSPYDVYTIYTDYENNIWFGTGALGAYRYDGKTLCWIYEKHLTEPASGGSFGIRSILEDSEGKYWICNNQFRFHIYPNETPNPNHDEKQKDQLQYQKEKGADMAKAANGDWIYYQSILEDHQRNIWMTTYKEGVWRYDGKNLIHFPVKDGTKDVTLFSMYKDNQGDLWLASTQAGAFKYNGKTFEKFMP